MFIAIADFYLNTILKDIGIRVNNLLLVVFDIYMKCSRPWGRSPDVWAMTSGWRNTVDEFYTGPIGLACKRDDLYLAVGAYGLSDDDCSGTVYLQAVLGLALIYAPRTANRS